MSRCDMFPLLKVGRLGILGGTFDPIHKRHIEMCLEAKAEFKLDGCILLVSGNPPHKSNVTNGYMRYEMAALAASEYQDINPCRLELITEGKTYTVNSLSSLADALPDVELFYIIGEDTLYELAHWREWEKVRELTSFICFTRSKDSANARRYARETLKGARIYFSINPATELSSSDVRRRVCQRLPVGELLDEKVLTFIMQKNLYSDTCLTFQKAREKLESRLSAKRFSHTMGTVETACDLAARYGADEDKARWAALLHDCAKCLTLEQGLELSRKTGVGAGFSSMQLLHASLGAYIAREEYGMYDEEVLTAIRCHTTGGVNMTVLDKVIFLADGIEPGRKYSGVEQLRRLAPISLDRAVLLAMEQTIEFLNQSGTPVNPQTLAARDGIKQRL